MQRINETAGGLIGEVRPALGRGRALLWPLLALLASSCQGPVVNRLAGNRLVLASKGANNQIAVSMSVDGEVWTEPNPVLLNGTPAPVDETPWIFYDGTLYHLYWIDRGNVRYATSSNGIQWLGQIDPLSRLSSGTSFSFARGPSKLLAAFRESGGRVVALDPSSSTAPRSTVTQSVSASATVPVSIAFGNGKFVAAVINSSRRAEMLQSVDDGLSWTSVSTLPAPDLYWVQLSYAENGFLLAAKQLPAACKFFMSPDAISWTEAANPGCSNLSTGILATRSNGESLFLENFRNQVLRTSRNSRPMSETHLTGVNGQFSIAMGKGPQIASLRLNQVTVNQGIRQDLTIIALGFRARIGAANTARVTFSGRLDQFASDVGVNQTVAIPPYVSPMAWLVQPAERLTENDGNLDVLGTVLIGIDRGACPEGPIRDAINNARSALEQELEARIAQGRLADLKDPEIRKRVLRELQDGVKQRLGGAPSSRPCTWLPSEIAVVRCSWFQDAVKDVFTETVCGFNRDEQLVEHVVVLLGSNLVPDDNPNNVFNFNSWNQTLRVTISNGDNTKRWTIDGARFLLSL